MKNPAFQPPPTKEPEIIPDVKELIDDVKTRNTLAKLVAQSDDWQKTEKEAKKAQKQADGLIQEALFEPNCVLLPMYLQNPRSD